MSKDSPMKKTVLSCILTVCYEKPLFFIRNITIWQITRWQKCLLYHTIGERHFHGKVRSEIDSLPKIRVYCMLRDHRCSSALHTHHSIVLGHMHLCKLNKRNIVSRSRRLEIGQASPPACYLASQPCISSDLLPLLRGYFCCLCCDGLNTLQNRFLGKQVANSPPNGASIQCKLASLECSK